jgi:RNA polymerase sigma factor (sigma-70 family)
LLREKDGQRHARDGERPADHGSHLGRDSNKSRYLVQGGSPCPQSPRSADSVDPIWRWRGTRKTVLRLLRDRREQSRAEPLPRAVDDLAALVAGCRRGERAAMATLLTAVGPSMLQMIRRVLGGRAPDLEDVYQESLMALVKALPAFRGDCSTRHFACRVATLTALKARRHNQAGIQEVLVADDEAPGESADQLDWALASCRRQALRRVLDELPGVQAEALVLHYIAGLTVEEIAGTLGAAVETVRSRLRLAKLALRERAVRDPSMLALLEDSL